MSTTPTPEQIKAGRKFWRPKMPECDQCPSCPFLTGNDAAFGAVMEKVVGAKLNHMQIALARARIKLDLIHGFSGDFGCHLSAYDLKTVKQLPRTQHKQCAGATKWWKDGGQLTEHEARLIELGGPACDVTNNAEDEEDDE